MELPADIKGLYRHWELHTAKSSGSTKLVPREVRWFIDERIRIWEQRVSGKEPPYTKDPVLSHYRFCNIFRELDRQTIEIHTMLNPLRSDFPLWLLNIFYARMVARPETLRHVGLLSFDKGHNKRLYKKLIRSPRPRYGTPYVFPVSVILKSKTPTRELFITQYLPKVMESVAREIQTWHKESVYDGVEKVLRIFGFRLHFLWTEVLIDVAYQFPEYVDLFKQFPIGPGAIPTFAVLAHKKDLSIFVEELAAASVATDITYKGKVLRLSAENWEGIGCEYRKYTNLKAGRGRRRIYKSGHSI
jgi:5-hmdU DNA kinase-like protein